MSSNHQPWYHSGLRFRCTGCGSCCTGAPGYVWVNKAEIEALAAAMKLDVPAFEKRYVRLVGIRKSLIEHANGDCVFFDPERRNCTVYSHRPRQCRTWPFWASNLSSPEAWEDMCERCPGGNRGPLVPLSKIQAALGVVDV
jgi:Fe-S-cluster containining protein